MLDRVHGLGMDAVALTDHVNMFGAVQFYNQALKVGIKPIIGCESTWPQEIDGTAVLQRMAPPNAYHLILLVMNDQGYRNLSRLVTLGHMEGFYYHPRADMELLREFNSGLIALSACLKGIIPSLSLAGQLERARPWLYRHGEAWAG